jgi:hypothetical protein
MTTCTATTAAGQPCKNHAVKGSQLCKAHGGSTLDIRHGAPLANSNAIKHGFYLSVIREDEYADLLKYAEQLDVADELAVLRTRLRRVLEYIDEREKTLNIDQLDKLDRLVVTISKTIIETILKLDGHQPDHWDIVLNQLSIDLGMDL